MKPLEPLAVPWTMKPLESARTRVDELDDGRMRYSIDHDVLHGVTPEMLVWWFSNMEGNVRIEGVPVPRYRAWHPRDHVAFRYHRRPARPFDGAVFEIHEVIGRRYEVDIVTDVRRLDDGGFRHFPRRRPAVMDYTFERVPGGTRYRNSLTVGFPRASARSTASSAGSRSTRRTAARGSCTTSRRSATSSTSSPTSGPERPPARDIVRAA